MTHGSAWKSREFRNLLNVVRAVVTLCWLAKGDFWNCLIVFYKLLYHNKLLHESFSVQCSLTLEIIEWEFSLRLETSFYSSGYSVSFNFRFELKLEPHPSLTPFTWPPSDVPIFKPFFTDSSTIYRRQNKQAPEIHCHNIDCQPTLFDFPCWFSINANGQWKWLTPKDFIVYLS